MRAVERQQSAAATCPSHRATEARLGRQSQAWIRKNRAVTLSTRLKRRTCSLESQRKERRIAVGNRPGGDAGNARQALCPQPWGERVGGVSERPTRETKRRNPFTCSRSPRWKAPRSSGCRLPSRVAGGTRVLVGPSRLEWGSFPLRAVAPATTGALWKKEEGNVVSVRNQTPALDVETPKKRSPRPRTRPSLGPETRARHPSSPLSPSPTARKCCGGRRRP